MRRFFYPRYSSSSAISWASLFLRLAFGISMIIGHGWRKLMMIISGDPVSFADPVGLGATTSLYLVVFSEFICSGLLVLGVFTRGVVVPLLLTMLVALFIVHGSDPFGKQEPSLLYATVYLVLFILGPGKFSIDRAIFNSKPVS